MPETFGRRQSSLASNEVQANLSFCIVAASLATGDPYRSQRYSYSIFCVLMVSVASTKCRLRPEGFEYPAEYVHLSRSFHP